MAPRLPAPRATGQPRQASQSSTASRAASLSAGSRAGSASSAFPKTQPELDDYVATSLKEQLAKFQLGEAKLNAHIEKLNREVADWKESYYRLAFGFCKTFNLVDRVGINIRPDEVADELNDAFHDAGELVEQIYGDDEFVKYCRRNGWRTPKEEAEEAGVNQEEETF